MLWSLIRRSLEEGVPLTTTTALGDDKLTVLCVEVYNKLSELCRLGVVLKYLRPNRQLDNYILSSSAIFTRTRSRLATLGGPYSLEFKIEQCVHALICLENHRPTAAPVSAIWTTEWYELFTAKATRPGASFAGFYLYRCFIDKFHRTYS